MFVMSGDLIEFIPQRAHAVYAMHELKVAAALIVHASIIDDCVANRFIYAPGDIERHARIVETPSPCILIHHPQHRTPLTKHSTDAIKEDGLAIGEVVQDIADGPLAWRVGARQVPTVEREALQRLVPGPFKLLNKVRAPSRRLRAPPASSAGSPVSWPSGLGVEWAEWRAPPSAHRLPHERADPCLFGGRQPLQREGDRPQGAFVEVRLVAEAERRVPRFELLRVLEVADDLAVLGIRGHPVPGCRREGWRAGFDDRMEPLGQPAIWFRHRGDLREHGALPVRRVRLQLLGALLHRGSFLVRESLELLA